VRRRAFRIARGHVFTNDRLRATRSTKTVNRVRRLTAAQPTGMRGQTEATRRTQFSASSSLEVVSEYVASRKQQCDGGQLEPSADTPGSRELEATLVSDPWLVSEIELHAELDESSDQDLGRPLPVAEGIVLQQHRARVERVVHIDVRARASASEVQQLREAEVDLVESIAVNPS
jgi:hypothetical protein